MVFKTDELFLSLSSQHRAILCTLCWTSYWNANYKIREEGLSQLQSVQYLDGLFPAGEHSLTTSPISFC